MLKHILFVFISASISASKFEPEFCDRKYFSFLIPGGIIGEALDLLGSGGIRSNFECHNFKDLPFTQQDLKYRLYTRTNQSSDWLVLTTDNLINLDRSKPTKIVLPDNFHLFKYYKTAVCNLKKAAELLGDFLCELKLDFNRVHVLGHSLGAQLAGLTGRRMKAKCNVMIDRITGLDPAGPIYQRMDQTQHLGKEDAHFVDVIHSNMGLYGYYGPLGHVDFYPFGGSFQSNCIKTKESASILDLLVLPASLYLCSHKRAVEYFADSILGPKSMFQAKSCTLTPKHLPIGTCLSNNKAQYNIMGEDCERNSSATEFVWRSNTNYALMNG